MASWQVSGTGPEDSGAGDFRKARLCEGLHLDTPIPAPFSGVERGWWDECYSVVVLNEGATSAWPSPMPEGWAGWRQMVAARSPRERLYSKPQRPAPGETIQNYSQGVKIGCPIPIM